MHLAKTTAEAKARSEAGVMSYFKTILDLRLDYTDWLNWRGSSSGAFAHRGWIGGRIRYGLRKACGDRR